ncbi:fumarylacetoacetate hydrolase family protein [Achromobacter aloeverae]
MNKIWCRFKIDEKVRFGKVDGERVVVLDGAPWEGGSATGEHCALTEVELLPPTIPLTFFCVGINYKDHILKMAAARGAEPNLPKRPDVGYRGQNALVGHEAEIVKPRDSGELFQYEGELVVVIGKKARNLSPNHVMDHVFGYTIGNDVSERTWQRSDRTNWRAKSSDTFKPMGPWIVTGLDYRMMTTVVRLNGEEVDRFSTSNMIFDIETYIAEISKYCTLYPGDVVWMGTEGAPRNMRPGDVCEVEISGIGTLRNKVVEQQ